MTDPGLDDAIGCARSTLSLDRAGQPSCGDNVLIYGALRSLFRLGRADVVDEFVYNGFLAGAGKRRAENIEPTLQPIEACEFEMGTEPTALGHFVGEAPRHTVRLSRFLIARTAVTNRLYTLLAPNRPGRLDVVDDLPVVDVTWFDATVFAMWVGCRLPTEAEWEYACSAGRPGEWSCGPVDRLPGYAWYSENARGRRHEVATREPNMFGLYDLHGNVWEWCHDTYHPNFYSHSPPQDPVNDAPAGGRGVDPWVESPHKAARGGGFLALSEMCRTRFRLHDPPAYYAMDLGFRLAAGL